MRSFWKRFLFSVFIILVTVSIGFITWASFPLGPGNLAQSAILSSDKVIVESINDWMVFTPSETEPTTGFIFYPGGRVDYRSYAPVLNSIAEKGYMVILVPMPLSMAFFSPDKADAVMIEFPEIQQWAIGGHSLGGAMAARYAYTHPGTIQALALWAAYPAASDDLTDYNLITLSIYGSQDGQVDKIEASADLLPANTQWELIDGGNHAQFGDYGLQPGDGSPTISPQNQWSQIVEATVALLSEITRE